MLELFFLRPSWPYGSWIYNYLCNQCISPLMLWVRTPLRWGVLDTTLCDKICQWLVTGQWFFPGTPVSSNNKTDSHDIAEILLKVALNTINPNLVVVFFPDQSTKIYPEIQITRRPSLWCTCTSRDSKRSYCSTRSTDRKVTVTFQ